MIKVVAFDLDDTLYCETEYAKSGFKAVSGELERMTGVDRNMVYEAMLDAFKADSRRVFDRALESLDVAYDKKLIEALIEVYRNHEPDIRLFCDADEILEYLRIRNYGIGIITDGYACSQWKKIKALELDKRADCIIVTDDFGRMYWKPHARSYEKLVSYFCISPDEAVYVGDNDEKDFITAKVMGIKTIKIDRSNGVYKNVNKTDEYKAELEIMNLLELKSYL